MIDERYFDSASLADAAEALIPNRITELEPSFRMEAAKVYATLAVFAELRALRKSREQGQPWKVTQ